MNGAMETVRTSSALPTLIKRNIKLFFKDKGMFFTALITPMILLVLYVTFLHNVYEDSFKSAFEGFSVPEETLAPLIEGLVGGLLLSSLLAVSTVTVSFCANLFIIQDKVTGARTDFDVSPTGGRTLAAGYYIATVANGMIISIVATLLGFAYLALTGWYLSALDVLAIFLDVFLLVLFGTALSSLICSPLKTQGQLSAVGSIVSSCYGFVCGAYMPISQFSAGLRNVISLLPGTYGTSLLRNHALSGVYEEMRAQGLPEIAIETLRDTADCNLYFFGDKVSQWHMYIVLIGAVLVIVGVYLLLQSLAERKFAQKRESAKKA